MVLGSFGQMLLTRTPEGPWAAVLGHPVHHSLSPVMHRAAYAVLGEELSYTLADVEEDDFATAVAPALQDPRWRGFSVTMPLKSVACRQADRLTGFAQVVGVINTLVPIGAGQERHILGHNTDVSGIVNALVAAQPHLPERPRAAILGGGGTATAATAALHILGADNMTVFVRNPKRTERVASVADRLGTTLEWAPLEAAPARMGEFDVIVSTLPARAFDDYASSISGDLTGLALLDVSYDPWPSGLAVAAQDRGAAAVSGRDMLLYQAVDQIKLFTGRLLSEELPHQMEVLRAMADAAGVQARVKAPRKIYDDQTLRPRR